MITTGSRVALAAALLCAACGPTAREGTTSASPAESAETFEAQLAPALASAAALPRATGSPDVAWGWSGPAIQASVSALAPSPGGGAVVLVSELVPPLLTPGLPRYLGWFDPAGELVGATSPLSSDPESVRLAQPGLAVTPDGLAVLALSLTCSSGRCPVLGGAALESGAHLAVFSPAGETWHVPLGPGEVQSLAMNAQGQAAVALSGPGGASIRLLDRTQGVVLDHFLPRLGGATRLAFAGDGTLLVGRGSTLVKLGAGGRELWSIDVGGGFVVEHVAAAGDRVAVVGARPDSGPFTAVLDGTGSIRWASAGGAQAIALDPGGALAAVRGLSAGKHDATGAPLWTWPQGQLTIFPNPIDVDAVAFVQGGVLAGGVRDGSVPFLVLLRDPPVAVE